MTRVSRGLVASANREEKIDLRNGLGIEVHEGR